MYNMQFQQSPYNDHQNQYDMSGVHPPVNNDKAGFPSPITNSSLDSPPNNNKMNNMNPYMPLPSSPKSYNRLQQQQYDMSNYMSAPTNFPPSISIPPSSNNIKTSTSPHQQQYYNGEENSISDTLVSPTSPTSIEEELVQRK